MTKERLKELLPVMQAWIESKPIEVRTHPNGHWEVYRGTCPDFDHELWSWRIKPEPREYWVNVYNGWLGNLYPTKETANKDAVADQRQELIHLREVLD